MNAWAAKRFWSDVNVIDEDGGFAIHLDARPVKTPAKAALIVPSRDMAQAIAAEWNRVDGKVDPRIMPFTRSANASIDKVATQFDDVANMLAGYGGSDLLCYRADNPAELVDRQAQGWDPMLEWTREIYGADLITTVGIMPVTQDSSATTKLAKPLFDATEFELAAFHDLIAMSGSLVLALGVTQRRLTAEQAWALSRIDETWQSEQWGIDDDALQTAEIKRQAFNHAADFYFMAKNAPDR